MYLRVTIDVPISYEEASFIKETFVKDYNCRELTLIPQKQIDEMSTDLDISAFVSVDVAGRRKIKELDTVDFNKVTLMEIYNGLE